MVIISSLFRLPVGVIPVGDRSAADLFVLWLVFEGGLLNWKLNSQDERLVAHKLSNLGCVPLGGSGSGFLIGGAPFKQILFQISDLSNSLSTRIHLITDLSDLQTDHWINDPAFLWVKDPKLITVCSGFGLELHILHI